MTIPSACARPSSRGRSPPLDRLLDTPFDALLLRTLAAHPRFIGTAALAAAREHCARYLEHLGYSVRRTPFDFSTVPARFGMPAIGFATILFHVAAWWSVRLDHRAAGLGIVAFGCVWTSVLARWLTGPNALWLSSGRIGGQNLEATCGGQDPRVWLVAHLDSKNQPLSLAVRAIAVTSVAGAWVSALFISTMGLLGVLHPAMGVPLVLAIAGGAPLLVASIGGNSPGAVDNASGVVAVLGAARELAGDGDVGILITDAEEAGLAGAYAWARVRSPGVAFNCDTVDDAGPLIAVWSQSRPDAACDAVSRAASGLGLRCELRRLPLGILTDGAALQRAGWECVTISRANWRTLHRIHTPRDSLEHFKGAGIRDATRLLVAAARGR